MEPIKISVDVNVKLSPETLQVLGALVAGKPVSAQAPTAQKPVQAPTTQKPAPTPATKPAQAPVTQKPAPTPAPAPTSSSISIEDVREALKEKVNDHRDEIKAKLTELGAPSVTKLDTSKYEEMYNFLVAL